MTDDDRASLLEEQHRESAMLAARQKAASALPVGPYTGFCRVCELPTTTPNTRPRAPPAATRCAPTAKRRKTKKGGNTPRNHPNRERKHHALSNRHPA